MALRVNKSPPHPLGKTTSPDTERGGRLEQLRGVVQEKINRINTLRRRGTL